MVDFGFFQTKEKTDSFQICYNKFAPISHVRFWGFQLMCVTMPSVGFIVYSGHKAKEKMRVEQSKKQEAKAQLMAEKVEKFDFGSTL